MKNVVFFLCIAASQAAFAAKVPDLTASVGHVFDGDTFSAGVLLENNARISVRVRLINIDAPEISGECDREIELAGRAKSRLSELLPNESTVLLSGIKDDKYLGRIDAYVKFPDGRDLGEIMIKENLAVRYNGGKRRPWCSADEIKQFNERSKK